MSWLGERTVDGCLDWRSIGLYEGHEWAMVLNLAGSKASSARTNSFSRDT